MFRVLDKNGTTLSDLTPSDQLPELKLREFCDRIGCSYRDARYALDRGVVPRGIDAAPGRGNHRQFDPAQAFYLGIVIKLKAAGIKLPVATKIVQWAIKVQGIAVNLGWDWRFRPFMGEFRTEKVWILEVADGCVRIGTDANPSRAGTMDFSPWMSMTTRRNVPIVAPVVKIQVDLSALAARLVSG